MRGRINHAETPALAAQRNETRGNAGDDLPSPTSRTRLLFVPEDRGTLLFLRGRYEGGIMGEKINDHPSTRRTKGMPYL